MGAGGSAGRRPGGPFSRTAGGAGGPSSPDGYTTGDVGPASPCGPMPTRPGRLTVGADGRSAGAVRRATVIGPVGARPCRRGRADRASLGRRDRGRWPGHASGSLVDRRPLPGGRGGVRIAHVPQAVPGRHARGGRRVGRTLQRARWSPRRWPWRLRSPYPGCPGRLHGRGDHRQAGGPGRRRSCRGGDRGRGPRGRRGSRRGRRAFRAGTGRLRLAGRRERPGAPRPCARCGRACRGARARAGPRPAPRSGSGSPGNCTTLSPTP